MSGGSVQEINCKVKLALLHSCRDVFMSICTAVCSFSVLCFSARKSLPENVDPQELKRQSLC